MVCNAVRFAGGDHGGYFPAGTDGILLDAERLDFAGKLCNDLDDMSALPE